MSSTANPNLTSGSHQVASNNMPPGVSVPQGNASMPPMYNGHPNNGPGMMNPEVAMRMRQQSKYRMGNPTPGAMRPTGMPPGAVPASGPGGSGTVRLGQQSPMGGMSAAQQQQMLTNQGMRQQVYIIRLPQSVC